MIPGSPYTTQYPNFIWRWLKSTRKGKDLFAPLFYILNKTKLYDHVLKHNNRYWMFIMAGGCLSSYTLSETCNNIWKSINKGKLVADLPYTYPVED
ncbi:conserved Plasmodium protein, unknown function [Babesia microti strain RI]|uniref:Cytochrome b-c1 complex subunit 9 n=1 Tax=Babesia microti (strain RI) TaxID=1133968 RepID=A0A1N6LXR3_BABMR|nr:conserved Plasmodium protein, unknown function [Babesia microti strain RI]SIO73654.1 conserved Plasmodium protein, unknown function [Babesia microti strain RI]|eukprot:XP_012649891.2 conserved Plasmodium protein, unknown function [Babesia microti strain RI]